MKTRPRLYDTYNMNDKDDNTNLYTEWVSKSVRVFANFIGVP